MFTAIRTKTPADLTGADLRLLATASWKMAGHDACLRPVTLWGWAGKKKATEVVYRCEAQIAKLSEDQLRRFVIDLSLIGEVRANQYDSSNPGTLLETAKRLRIDVEAIRKSLKVEQANKDAKRREPKSERPTKKSARKAAA